MRLDRGGLVGVFACAAILFMGCSDQPVSQSDQSTQQASAAIVESAPRSAAEVVQSFMLAMMTGDERGIEKTVLPHPNSGVLTLGVEPPAAMVEQLRSQVDSMTVKELKAGDTMYLPGSRQVPVTAQMVNATNKLVVPSIGGQPMPTPVPLRMFDGRWRVDASSIIEARMAAQQ